MQTSLPHRSIVEAEDSRSLHDMLSSRTRKLPRELQDLILDFALSLDDRMTVTKDYKPPTGLHINRARRATFAKTYYSQTAFMFWGEPMSDDHYRYHQSIGCSYPHEHYVCMRWMKAIDSSHLAHLQCIRVHDAYPDPSAIVPITIFPGKDPTVHYGYGPIMMSGEMGTRYRRGWTQFEDLRTELQRVLDHTALQTNILQRCRPTSYTNVYSGGREATH